MEDFTSLAQNVEDLSMQMVYLKQIKNQVATREERNMDEWLKSVECREREFDDINKEFGILRSKSDDVNNLEALETLFRKVIENLNAVNVLKDEGNASLESSPVLSNNMEHKTFACEDLIKFTSNFSKKVGSGGYSNVYKGQLDPDKQVAVKVLKNTVVIKDFMAEIQTMLMASHPNLVTLHGFCFDYNMKALVYEFMENGSFDKILFHNHHNLEWGKLYGISLETAKGLAYLHCYCAKQIIHRDVKPSNVLIDIKFSPKITDFGLAKLISKDADHYTISQNRGTEGYIAPEFGFPTSLVTNKCDVYSFGVTLFEVLRKEGNGEFGANWFPLKFWEKLENGELDELINSFGIPETHKGKAKILSMVAFWCCQYTVAIRPSMSTVVQVLENEILVNTPPNPFDYYNPPPKLSMLPSQEVILKIHSEASPAVHEIVTISNPTIVAAAPEEAEKDSNDEQAMSNFSVQVLSEETMTSSKTQKLLDELTSRLPQQFSRLDIESLAIANPTPGVRKRKMLTSPESLSLSNPTIVSAAPEEAEKDSDDEQAMSNFSKQVSSEESMISSETPNLLNELTSRLPQQFSRLDIESLALSNPTIVAAAPEEAEMESDDEQAMSNFSEQVLSEESMTSSETQNLLSELTKYGLQQFSYSDIERFTTNFSEYIGRGGFGDVYKGQLLTGVEVTIEVLHDYDGLLNETTFLAIGKTMWKLYHPNIAKLHGYCFEGHAKALVFEYVRNGSLDMILFRNHRPDIDWDQLYKIAIEIAKELSALHTVGIIHRGIEASSILLDSNLSPKVTSFELEGLIIMERDVRSIGYSSPEMWMPTSVVTCKSDVYSFGMLLFEVLGRRSISIHRGHEWFPAQVWKMFSKGQLSKFMEDCGISKKDREKGYNLSKVALWCAQFDPEERPFMSRVVNMLEMKIPVMDPPNPFPHAHLSSTSSSPEVSPKFNSEASTSVELRQLGDSLEQDPAYPSTSYKSIAGGGHNGPEDDGGATLPDILEEDFATLVPNQGMKLPTTKLVGKTTLKYKEIILQWIAKDEVVTIGVHGMGGVGKTTIFKHVHNQLLAEGKYFDKIIWVTVSKDGNITKLQNDLGKELDLNLSFEDNVHKRSRLLFQALEKRKRVVFFFDDMWTKFSLDEIGIPEPTNENGFKIILTTRLLDVCRRMGCHEDNTIKVEGLPKDEAWELLMSKIDCVLSPEVEEIAEIVAKKCSGLPLAIVTVGGAMRGNSDIKEWKVALNDLNMKDPSNRTMNMEDSVYECLKFSYDRLENEKQRKCFLFCALYPEDYGIVIRDLVNFWVMDGLVEGRNRQEELVKGQYILSKLKGHCLLETVDEIQDYEYHELSDGVKMHDSVRDMALRLTNKCFMVRNSPDLKELPNEEEWKVDLEKASFMVNCIEAVSISPKCPNLTTLIIGGVCLKSVTHDFFVHMERLKILDFRFDWNDYLESLPNSISDLEYLHALCLQRNRSLKKLPSLAKLVLLKKLDLRETGIEELPEGIEMLINLRCLNLQDVELKKRIPIGLISKFSLLEELYLWGIKADKLYSVGRGECFTEELLSLKHLENLSVTFHCLSDYVSYVGSPKFNGFKCFLIAIGEAVFHYRVEELATIKLGADPSNDPTAFFILPNTKRLEIQEFHDVIRLNELGWLIKDEKHVSFTIRGCKNLECIWSSKEFSATATSSSTCWLRSVETIDIFYCPKLYTIFEGIPIFSGVFCLKELKISDCENLKKVFPSSRLLQLLPNIEKISIDNCDELEELIGDDDEEETETPIAIPKLKYLEIRGLHKLKRIWRGVMICDSLEGIEVINCYKLKSLPQLKGEEQSTPPPALMWIQGRRKWWDSLEWGPAYPKNILQPFFVEDEDDDYGYFDLRRRRQFNVRRRTEFHSDEPAPEGAGIDREKTFQLDHNVPIGFICDNCEMYPIVGKGYRCKDCWEKCIVAIAERGIGFYLSEECYNTPSKHSDLVNHHHTQGHTFELIVHSGDSSVPVNLTLSL